MKAKNFIIKGLIFVTGILVLAVILEVRTRELPSIYAQKAEGFEKKKQTVEVLVLGASQANQGISPALLEREAYNLANVGQDAYYDKELVLRNLDSMPRLRLVVLPVSYISFEYNFFDTPEFWRTFCYSLYFGIRNEFEGYRYDLRNVSVTALREPLKAIGEIAFNEDESVELDESGFQKVAPVSETIIDLKINELTGRKRIRYHHTIMRTGNIAVNEKYYDELFTGLSKRGVKAVFVVLPVEESYYGNVSDDVLERRGKVISALTEKHKIGYFDYFEDERFDIEDFSDVDHLNVNGATKFTSIIKNDFVDKVFQLPVLARR